MIMCVRCLQIAFVGGSGVVRRAMICFACCHCIVTSAPTRLGNQARAKAPVRVSGASSSSASGGGGGQVR